MKDTQLPQLNELLGESMILFCFSGPFHQELIEELGKAIQNYLESMDNKKEPRSVFRNVFAVFIEQSQNVKRYLDSLHDAAAERSGIVVIGRNEDGFFVKSGNRILKGHREDLEERLKKIQAMNKDELKQLYKETIRSERGNASAGLGFIDMARKANRQLVYSITSVDASYDFFSLSVQL
ncbi:SiaB family protein kinase [Spirochaeta dissipatitropha]